MKSRAKEQAWTDADVSAALRQAGLRGTAARRAVLRWMATTRAPVSHADAVQGLTLLGADRATLYRNLVDLAEHGILRRTDFGDHVWRFELRPRSNDRPLEHAHFVCSNCGEVSCLTGVAVQIVDAASAPRAVRHRKVTVQLAGRCDECSDR